MKRGFKYETIWPLDYPIRAEILKGLNPLRQSAVKYIARSEVHVTGVKLPFASPLYEPIGDDAGDLAFNSIWYETANRDPRFSRRLIERRILEKRKDILSYIHTDRAEKEVVLLEAIGEVSTTKEHKDQKIGQLSQELRILKQGRTTLLLPEIPGLAIDLTEIPTGREIEIISPGCYMNLREVSMPIFVIGDAYRVYPHDRISRILGN